MATMFHRDPALWRRWRMLNGRYQFQVGCSWRDCTAEEVAEIEDRIAHPNRYGWEGA